MAGRPTGLLSEWLKSVRDGTDLKGCRTKHDICSLPPSPLPHALLPGTAAFAGGFSPRFSRKRSTTTALTSVRPRFCRVNRMEVTVCTLPPQCPHVFSECVCVFSVIRLFYTAPWPMSTHVAYIKPYI